MGIANFIDAALDEHRSQRRDVALALACAALDATSAKAYPGKKSGERYRAFVRDNLDVITAFGFPGLQAGAIRLRARVDGALDKKDIDADGYVGIEAILYTIVRCGLVHECDIGSQVEFTQHTAIGDFTKPFPLPENLVLGLVASVVLHPKNIGETSRGDLHLEYGGRPYFLNDLWGKGKSVMSF